MNTSFTFSDRIKKKIYNPSNMNGKYKIIVNSDSLI